jgi:hypothetical protein
MDGISLLGSQITIGAVTSYFLQVLKNAKWFPVMKQDGTRVVNILVSLVASAAAITGISYKYSSTDHTLLLTNVSWMMVLTAAYHWLSQYVIQHGWYKLAFSGAPSQVLPPTSAPVGTTGSFGPTALDLQKQQKIDEAKKKLEDAQKELADLQKK